MGNPADPKRKNISFVNDDCFQGAGAGEKKKTRSASTNPLSFPNPSCSQPHWILKAVAPFKESKFDKEVGHSSNM